ncbi:MAG: hypothetical protein HY043_10085 [Verrucomicrobia bacterium]|nr:hypothetical protein [Verrucomicrobiota bacterium]
MITGLNGSAKLSLAFDIIFAEGPRKYVESLPAYAHPVPRPDAKAGGEFIEGLSPAIAIEQRSVGAHPRSTNSTTTGIVDKVLALSPSDPSLPVPVASTHSRLLRCSGLRGRPTILRMVSRLLRVSRLFKFQRFLSGAGKM